MPAVLSMQVNHEIELSVPVKIPCPDDRKVWIISESVSRVQHLCSSPVGQDDPGVGERRVFGHDAQLVAQPSKREIQWPVVMEIVVGDACALDFAGTQTRNAPDGESHLRNALDRDFQPVVLWEVFGPFADN
jgi:hypothetical protein